MQSFEKADVNHDGAVSREEFVRQIMSTTSTSTNANDQGHFGHNREAGRLPEHSPPVGHQRGGPPAGFGGGEFRGPRGGSGPGGAGGAIGPRSGRFGPESTRGPGRAAETGPRPFPSAEAIFTRFDRDHKGVITKENVPDIIWDRFLSKADTNDDGSVSREELDAHFNQTRTAPPEKNDPPKSDKPDEKKPEADKPIAKEPQVFHQANDLPADALTALTPEN